MGTLPLPIVEEITVDEFLRALPAQYRVSLTIWAKRQREIIRRVVVAANGESQPSKGQDAPLWKS